MDDAPSEFFLTEDTNDSASHDHWLLDLGIDSEVFFLFLSLLFCFILHYVSFVLKNSMLYSNQINLIRNHQFPVILTRKFNGRPFAPPDFIDLAHVHVRHS